MIREGRAEDLKAIYNLRKIQVNMAADSQELYFQHRFEYHNVLVNEVDNRIRASLQMDYHPMMLKGYKIMCSELTGQFYDGSDMAYYTQLLTDAMKQLQCTTLVTVVFGNKNERYHSFGFEPVYYSRIYTIKKSALKGVSDSGVSRRFALSEMRDLYNEFTSHFDGCLVRDGAYWQKLMDYYIFMNYFVVIYRDDNEKAQGYMIYHLDGNGIFVDEIVYASGLALLRLLAYGVRIKPQLQVRVSQYEDLSLALPSSRFRLEPNAEVRINDLELFSRLYQQPCGSTADGFLNSAKPLWISRGY